MSAPSRLLSQSLHSAISPRQSILPPSFLLPSLVTPQSSSSSSSVSFSTCSPARARQDRNRNRGVSALRSTGPRKRQTLSVKLEDLPKPVAADQRSEIQVDPEHGLWQFFNRDKLPFATPEYDNAHGRAWTVNELRSKDWEDLHRLWWVCLKERNRLSTERRERNRVKAGYGDLESEERLKEVKLTQRAIKHVLTERWYAWEDARKIAASDPEVNLAPTGSEPAYNPREFEMESQEASAPSGEQSQMHLEQARSQSEARV